MATGGFFAPQSQQADMSVLRDALRELPDAVFADLLESETAYLLVIDVPGATSEDIEATVTHGTLHVEASRSKTVPAGYEAVSAERSSTVSVDLPVPTDATGRDADASLERGVLELRLPKESESSSQTIPVE